MSISNCTHFLVKSGWETEIWAIEQIAVFIPAHAQIANFQLLLEAVFLSNSY
ncbi:MAG: hypothetical protein WBA89_27870 [Microcoleus sp.]|uniref:hypothetical protein n=1 Tax=Microcoleus sp. TaxID=44472 RepID=UPI003C755F10